MAKKLKVMFSTHGLVEGDFGFELDEKGYPTSKVISKKVITGQDTGGQVYYVKALAANSNNYDVDLVTRRVDPRICPQFGGTPHDLGKDINYTIEQQWHDSSVIRSRVLRVPAGGHFNFVPKEEIAANGYDLSINKYKETEYVPVEYPSTTEILADLHELEMEITKGLAELEEMV